MFGSHLSIAGGVHNALIAAQSLGIGAVQIFTANQRQWSPKGLSADAIALWEEQRAKLDVKQVVSHDSYLINVASPKAEPRERSIALLRDELLRCEALNIPWLVMHPGSHLESDEQAGLAQVAAALDELHDALPDIGVTICLEITAGQGTNLGHRLEHLAAIIQAVKAPDRLAVCLDTAHMLGAGYDLTSAKGAKATLREVDRVVGLDRVKVLHLNDSKAPLGSRKDRHEHIGHGHVSLEAFEVFVNEPAFADAPMILETAKEPAPDGRPWDAINLDTLRGLVRRRQSKVSQR